MKILALAFLLFSNILYADPGIGGGSRVGNGGSGCVCRNNGIITKVTLLDLNLAEELKYSFNRATTEEIETIIYKKLVRISRNKLLYSEAERELNIIKSITKFESGNFELGPVNDYTKMVCKSKYGDNCNVEQIANYTYDGKLLIVDNKFKLLSNADKAALFIHEIFYSLDRKRTNAKTSDWAQEITAKLFAENTNDNDIIKEISRHFLLSSEEASKITTISLHDYLNKVKNQYAILSIDKLKYLILSGADINEIVDDESVLTKFIQIEPTEKETTTYFMALNLLIENEADINFTKISLNKTFLQILMNKHRLFALDRNELARKTVFNYLLTYYESLISLVMKNEKLKPSCVESYYSDTGNERSDPLTYVLESFKDKGRVLDIIKNIKYSKSFSCQNGNTPFHNAIIITDLKRDTDYIQAFFDANFNCSVKNKSGKTPVDIFNKRIGYCISILPGGNRCEYRSTPFNDSVRKIFKTHDCEGKYYSLQSQ